MRKILLATGMLLATMSSAHAEDVGYGRFYGDFITSEMDMGLIGTDPTMYGDGMYNAYAENYLEYMGEGSSYRWGVWNDDMDPSGYGWSANNLSFYGNEFNGQEKGQSFVAGTINYTNGTSLIGSNPSGAMLLISSQSFTGSLDFEQQLLIEVAIDSSPNSDSDGFPLSQELAADYIYFPMFPEFGSLRVFEGETGSVEILAEFNSLHFKGFGDVLTPDTAFLSSSINTSPVPLPAAVWFFGSGLLGLVGMNRRKKLL